MEEPQKPASDALPSGTVVLAGRLRRELAVACGLLLRFPVPFLDATAKSGGDSAQDDPDESDGLRRRAHRVFPLAGFLIGAILAVVWAIAWSLSHNPWLASAFCVAASVFLTGALHEDGLADSADLLGVPPPREAEKIQAVLDDPHHGTYGVAALVLSLVLRVVLLATFASGIVSAFVLLLISETLSRAAAGLALCHGSATEEAGQDKAADEAADKTASLAADKTTSLAAGWRPKNEEAAPEFVLLLAVVLVFLVSFAGGGGLRVAVSALVFAALLGGAVWHGLRRLHSPGVFGQAAGQATGQATEEAGAGDKTPALAGDGLGALQQAVLIASLFGAAIAL